MLLHLKVGNLFNSRKQFSYECSKFILEQLLQSQTTNVVKNLSYLLTDK